LLRLCCVTALSTLSSCPRNITLTHSGHLEFGVFWSKIERMAVVGNEGVVGRRAQEMMIGSGVDRLWGLDFEQCFFHPSAQTADNEHRRHDLAACQAFFPICSAHVLDRSLPTNRKCIQKRAIAVTACYSDGLQWHSTWAAAWRTPTNASRNAIFPSRRRACKDSRKPSNVIPKLFNRRLAILGLARHSTAHDAGWQQSCSDAKNTGVHVAE